jgi:hypothetical protein
MFTCLECAKKLVEENRLESEQLMKYVPPGIVSFGKCEFCLRQKETVDFHHLIIKPNNQK